MEGGCKTGGDCPSPFAICDFRLRGTGMALGSFSFTARGFLGMTGFLAAFTATSSGLTSFFLRPGFFGAGASFINDATLGPVDGAEVVDAIGADVGYAVIPLKCEERLW